MIKSDLCSESEIEDTKKIKIVYGRGASSVSR